jgi:hypothetical protein
MMMRLPDAGNRARTVIPVEGELPWNGAIDASWKSHDRSDFDT